MILNGYLYWLEYCCMSDYSQGMTGKIDVGRIESDSDRVRSRSYTYSSKGGVNRKLRRN
jgi:hypothetical protein